MQIFVHMGTCNTRQQHMSWSFLSLQIAPHKKLGAAFTQTYCSQRYVEVRYYTITTIMIKVFCSQIAVAVIAEHTWRMTLGPGSTALS